jgi:hypothetical protein
MNKRNRFINPLLALISLFLTLAALETVIRIKTYIEDREKLTDVITIESRLENAIVPPKGSNVELGHMIRLNDNDRILYELKPDMYYHFKDILVKTSAEGFRDRSYPIPKGKETIRIIGIGDSIMFGQGVPEKDIYLSVLETLLNNRYPQKKWEAINTAVPDYNAVIEVETLKTKGLRYRPDIVIVGYCTNDFWIARWCLKRADYLSLRRSFLLEFIRDRTNPFRANLADVPSRFRGLGGRSAYLKAMRDLKEMSMENDFSVIVFFFSHEMNKRDIYASERSAELGFINVKMEPVLKNYMKKNNIGKYRNSPLDVADGHPSSLGHGIAARTLFQWMEATGLIDSAMNKSGGAL